MIGLPAASRPPAAASARPGLVELYLADLAERAPDVVAAVGADLDAFFATVARDPLEVTVVDVLSYATRPLRPALPEQAAPSVSRIRNVFRFYGFLVEHPDIPLVANPVPDMLADRRSRRRSLETPEPEVPAPKSEVLGTIGPGMLLDATRTARDRAILAAILFGALRVGEVVTLTVSDLDRAGQQVVARGTRWLRRVVPVAPPFFSAVERYLAEERPADLDSDLLFVALRGQRRGAPLSPGAVQDIVARACAKVGLPSLNSGDLRLACLAALRTAGMNGEALRVFAGAPGSGNAALSSADLAEEYQRAAGLLDIGWFGSASG